MNRNEYIMYGSPEYEPDYKRKSQHVVPTLIWCGTMMYYFCYYVSWTGPTDTTYACWAYPYGNYDATTDTGIMMTYGTSPPSYYNSESTAAINISTEDYINMSRSFWAINVGGIALCLSHILSCVFHFIRPLHKIAKPFQLLNLLCTLPYLIMATLWRFCEGG